jgi:hypothetical protein
MILIVGLFDQVVIEGDTVLGQEPFDLPEQLRREFDVVHNLDHVVGREGPASLGAQQQSIPVLLTERGL